MKTSKYKNPAGALTIPTLDEYLEMKRQEAIQAAIASSYSASEPILAKRYYSDQDIKRIEEDNIRYNTYYNDALESAQSYENLLRAPFSSKDVFYPNPKYMIRGVAQDEESNELFNRYENAADAANQYKRFYDNTANILELAKSQGYDWTGHNCITNATGWYGKPYVCASNIQFKANPAKYGFMEINPNDALPGDIFQYDQDGVPGHATMYSKKGDDDIYYSNYSNGGFDKSSLVKDSKYWGIGNRAFRFIGLPEDIERWTKEWEKQYGALIQSNRYGGILFLNNARRLLNK